MLARLLWRAAFLSFLAPVCTTAQEMKPLEELMQSGAEETYPLVRCAGFYLSMLEWMGENRAGEEASQRVKDTLFNLIQAAVSIRSESSGNPETAVFDYTMRDVRNMSDLYLKRFEENYASVGQAWGADELWEADQQICMALTGG